MRLAGIFAIVLTIAAQALLTFFALDPSVGFDDANITQGYARNIAEGHGFVYNIGGERVEGSTSFLWTMINVLAFWTGDPIVFLHLIAFLICSTTLFYVFLLARRLGGTSGSAITAVLALNFFPAYFGWSFWSLMDTSLFVLAISAATTHFFRERTWKNSLLFCLWVFLLPLIRPEGVVVAMAIVLFQAVINSDLAMPRKRWPLTLASALVSFAAVTAFRLAYFGYPAPNTFYAKTSTDLVGQFAQGIEYVLEWLSVEQNYALIVVGSLAAALLWASQDKAQRTYAGFLVYLSIGGTLFYTALGGDHFQGGRFLQFIIPLAAVAIGAGLSPVFSKRGIPWIAICACVVTAGYTSAKFLVTGGWFTQEFRIAENGRALGQQLNEDIGSNYSIAVVAAGGIRMGFEGQIYDVLGLNWAEMAHRAGVVDTGALKNHGGFNESVFLAAEPDIAFPELGNCDASQVVGEFVRTVTRDIQSRAEFTELYTPVCGEHLVFYAHESILDDVFSQGFQFLRLEPETQE